MEIQTELKTKRVFRLTYRENMAAFIHDCIDWRAGESPTEYQTEMAERLVASRRLCVRALHGVGKTAFEAMAVLWFTLINEDNDFKVPTTASAWRQLEKYLWPEIHKWSKRLRWDRIGRGGFTDRELLQLSLKLSGGEAFAVASDNSDLIEGAHADFMFYGFDEAKSIPEKTWDAAEGAFSTDTTAYALAISTPGEPQGRFYDIQTAKTGYEDWDRMHITLERALKTNRINEEWVRQRRLQWGEKSAIFQNRVMGEFAADETEGVIPLSWVEAANERWRIKYENGNSPATWNVTTIGLDVARTGEDKTVFALRDGYDIIDIRRTTKEDTMETTGRAKGLLTRWPEAQIIVDVIGIGAGVVDRLRELNYNVVAFNAAEGSDQTDISGELGFRNKRSEAWWRMRELLDPANEYNLALPPDDQLLGDLTAPHWRVLSGGKIAVESKDEIKKRIGRSTDTADAVIQAYTQETNYGILI